ncbi:gliding motility-associated C-terminal domain-containing protein [Filimonas lacunae]|uniref:Gliding motility-associated C-terminal domain-containing protein n=2 Tax=Filimonas lacunae TaxID=477680 RepID=A0A173MIB7_9BACT|nr:PKD domain-containing protein [Filimonas lacunae]BAV07158.1 internalin [Filimonas lacunae]SIS94123.1 gliding motility-associated C-terminal domain-containing protein [Filimonas lacunae]
MLACVAGLCNLAEGQQLTNAGKEFWVGYGHHQFFETGNTNGQEMVLYLSAEQAAKVTVSINGTTWSRDYNVAANTVVATEYMPKSGLSDCRLYTIPPSFGGTGSEGVFNRGIHIVSDVPIVAYAHIFGANSSGATMLLPVNTWGFTYTSLNFTQYFNIDCFSWLNVIANHDNTKVQITTTTPTRGGHNANETFEITLNKGQVYQMLGAGISNPAGNGYDITGTTVKSVPNAGGECYPIAVFSGSSRTRMFLNCTTSMGGDNYIQQVFPSQAWGKQYLTAPTSISTSARVLMPNYYRVLVNDPATVVKWNGIPLTGLINNQYYEFSSSSADYISADKPIMVAQYMPSTGCNGSVLGDEEMFYISPMEQAIKHVAFYRNTKMNIEVNYLTLIIPTEGVKSLKIDGSSTFDYQYAHTNMPGYTVIVKRWKAAQAQVSVSSDSAFTAITYGEGGTESYGYNAGAYFDNLNGIGEIKNLYSSDTTASVYTCRKTPFLLAVWIAYKPTQLLWAFSEAGNIVPATDVMEVNPVAVDSQKINNVWYYRYKLAQSYSYTDTGMQVIPVYSTHPAIENCNHTEIINIVITVKNNAVADFSFSNSRSGAGTTNCRLDTFYFAAQTTATRLRWSFSTDIADTSLLATPAKYYAAAGIYPVHLQGIYPDGCVADTVKNVQVYQPPTAGFTLPAGVCAQTAAPLTGTGAYSGPAAIQGVYWQWGDGRTSTDMNTTSVTYANAGTYTVKQVVKVSGMCVSDTASKVITVYGKPTPAFTASQGCLGADGMAQFTNTSTVSDNQTMTYLWSFGDPASGAANASTITDPKHYYSAYNTYTISLQATTSNGCVADTLVRVAFSLKPAFTYDALDNVCVNTKGTVSVAKAAVTNGVEGSGVYWGPGTDGAGNFTAAIAGEGTHSIWYVFQAKGGCRDSAAQTITVYPKPTAAFTAGNTSFCANTTTTLADASTITSGTIQSWYWNLGNGKTVMYANGSAFTAAYAAGNYTVKHVVMSDKNCVSDTASQILAVHPLPVADFTVPGYVCLPAGKAQFTNKTTVQGGESMAYVWNFGDGSTTTTTVHPLHTYASAGTYIIRLQATTASGCVHDTTKNIAQFYNQPQAGFTVSPEAACQDATVKFTNTSVANGGSITKWNWLFGDGTTSSTTNPDKKYEKAGDYVARLIVNSSEGCASDTASKNVSIFLRPVVDAGPDFIVEEGASVTLAATVTDATAALLWTPAAGLSNATALRPTLVAMEDITYKLTATNAHNCTGWDTAHVKILRTVLVPNIFTPNGDGINDTWVIKNLSDYTNAVMQVFDRYGSRIWQLTGYAHAWDGTVNQKPVPPATYYYIIDLKNGTKPLSGAVTIIR